jgi:DNA-binding PucR family transcriptional regulator
VNTVYYRLRNIAERSACNLRNVSEVVEVLIAAKLLQGGHPAPSQPAELSAAAVEG